MPEDLPDPPNQSAEEFLKSLDEDASGLSARMERMAREDEAPAPKGGGSARYPRVVVNAMDCIAREERYRGEHEVALKVIEEWAAGRIKPDDGDLTLLQWDQLYYSIAEEIEDPGAIAESRPKLDRKRALHGIVGEIVRRIEPHTESDPAGLLMQSLAVFGSMAGRNAFYQVEATRHYPNLFVVLVGMSARARKGTSWGQVRRVLQPVDEYWYSNCIDKGLSSGEGLIARLSDPKYRGEGEQRTLEDAGVSDKRLLVPETEFGRVLKQFERDTNILSIILRDAWDGGDLSTMTKKATRASSTHISVVGHITSTELVKLLTDTEAASGFANRFLWPMVHRVQVLPFGGEVYKVNFTDVRIELKQCLEFARMVCINPDSPGLRMNKQARDLWEVLYRKHSQGQPGMMGAVTSRGDAQTCRLALIYALLDKSPDIKLEHLSAAAAAWEYCEASARFIFGDKIGNPAADVIFRRLRGAPDGMTRSQINDFFAGKKSGKEIEAALKTLRIQGLAHPRRQDTGGRPRELWFPGEALN